MKLKYLFISIIACLALFGCKKEDIVINTMSELKVSNSYISIPKDGGTITINIIATENWAIDTTGKKATWLTLTPISGGAGEFAVSFKAEATTKTRKIEDLPIKVGTKVQYINVEQSIGITPVSEATCAEVIAGADGKTYKVTGSVASIVNTEYGNWYIADATGQVYIYGTLDKNGGTKNFKSWGIEVGDKITVEGPKTTYNGTVELVDVTVTKLVKSLISAVDKEINADKGDTTINIRLVCKGNGVNFSIPEEDQDWISIRSIVPAVGDTVTVSVGFTANTAGARGTTLQFATTSGGVVYGTEVEVLQEGEIAEVTLAEFKEAPVSTTALYRLTGKITSFANKAKGRFYVADDKDTLYVYGFTITEAGKSLSDYREGDIFTFLCKRGQYKETIEALESVLETAVTSTDVTVAQFKAAEVSTSVYYRLTGTVSNFKSTVYGNFDLTDSEGNTIYVYGVTRTPMAKNDKSFESLKVVAGDKITIVGYRAAYKGTAQVGNAYFVTKVTE